MKLRILNKMRSGQSLQYKMNLFIFLSAFLVLLNFPLFYFEMRQMNNRMMDFELMEELYNTILELRRYEKNVFLYRDQESIQWADSYFKRTRDLLSDLATLLVGSKVERELNKLESALNQYRAIERFRELSAGGHLGESEQAEIRIEGKRLVDAVEELLRVERKEIASGAKNAFRWPIFILGSMFLLFLFVARRIITGVIHPLAMIERATEKIARGDFSPIPYSGKDNSQVDHLVDAFNRMARELEAREEQIIHSRKIASMGTLVSGIAHELNNPINNIILTADVLSGGKRLSEERKAALIDDILSQAMRASEIVKNLLEFSRAETGGYSEIDLVTVLRETIQIAENHFMVEKVKLHDEISETLPKIRGNRQGLQQVFLNLITNAVHAMPDGGDLTIRTAFDEDNRKIILEVQDTGIGIPEEHLPHIFDPFFTTKDIGKGTGLGLSVSYGIVKKHGGQITVKSKPGEGTIFTITLPIQDKRKE